MDKLSMLTMPYRCRLIVQAYNGWIKKNNRILDVGCGTGIVSSFILKYFDVSVTGCDIENYLIFNLPFVKIQKGKLPFLKRSYDLVLLNDVLHHCF